MTPRVQRAEPPFIQIASHFRQEIIDGTLLHNTQLPTIATIAENWGVSASTAAKALRQLQLEGYVRATTQGTFVDLTTKVTIGPDRLHLLHTTGNGHRPQERVEILDAQFAPAPEDVAKALDITEGDLAVQRRRRYLDDQGVITVATSWLAKELGELIPELFSPDSLPQMTFGLVEERTGRRAARRREVVTFRTVPADITTPLEIETGGTALVKATWYWDQDGTLIEYAVDFLGAGRELSTEDSIG